MSIEKIKESDDFESCINYVVDNINKCYEGSNNITTDQKAVYNPSSKTLIIFIGKSQNDFFSKWEIPLSELDERTVKIDTNILDFFEVHTLNKIEKIKYYNKIENNENSSDINYYLPSYCYKKRDKQMFVESFKRAIILSKRNN